MTGKRLPVLFMGHGSPMNAIEENEISRGWQEFGASLPRPDVILCVSAHWETVGVKVTANEKPPTIHDFMGFPKVLQELSYPADGSRKLVEKLVHFDPDLSIQGDYSWGLDHGTWSVLRRLFPKADVPVVQLSLDRHKSPREHFELGRSLRGLRENGVLIVGSGNIVHNLRMIGEEKDVFEWAVRFDGLVKQWINASDYQSAIDYEQQGEIARLAVNSGEHYLPLLYTLGASYPDEKVHFFNELIWGGAFSMRCVQFG